MTSRKNHWTLALSRCRIRLSDNRVYETNEIADVLDIARATAHRLCKTGAIPACRPDGERKWRATGAVIRAFVARMAAREAERSPGPPKAA